MATHDYVIANQSGAAFRTDLNNALSAIVSNNSNSSSPSTTYAYQWWADTSNAVLKIRNSANNAWIDFINLDGTIARDITLTGASANIVFDQSDNALEFADNAKATFGTGADLTISHDGSNSTIEESGTGGLVLATSKLNVNNSANDEIMITATQNGSVELYEDHQLRLTTTTSGIEVTRTGTTSDTFLVIKAQDDASSDATLQLEVINTSAHSRINFGDSGDADVGRIDYDHSENDLSFKLSGSDRYEMDTGAFHPTTDDGPDVGRSTNRFDNIRATNGSIVTSDRNEKNTIVASDLGLDFINKLSPVSYKFNNKTRTHYGLIAQDIETLLGTLSKTATDFAGFCKDEIKIKTEIDEDGNAKEVALDTPFDRYGLRYTEFIAPMIKAIQELSAKVTALEGS